MSTIGSVSLGYVSREKKALDIYMGKRRLVMLVIPTWAIEADSQKFGLVG